MTRIAGGGSAIDPDVVDRMVERKRRRSALDGSRRARGKCWPSWPRAARTQALANELFLNPKTVESHVASIFTKLDLLPEPDCHRRVLAMLTDLHTGEGPPGDPR